MTIVALGDICQFNYGKALPDRLRREGSVPVFGSNGRVGQHDEAQTDGPALVIGRKGSIGEINYSSEPCWPIDTTYYVDRTATDQDLKWLYYVLPSLGLGSLNKATGVPGLNRNDAYEKKLFLPPLEEQRRIAAILDQADEVRRKRLETLTRADLLIHSLFVSGFGKDPTSRHFASLPLDELCDLVRGSSPRPQGDPRYFGGPIPRLMISDITRDRMYVSPSIDSLTEEGASRSRPMPAGSVVMAVSGAVGLPAILAVDACIHDGFVGFRNLDGRILPIFFYFWLLTQRAENSARGTGAIWINLNTDQVRRFEVPIPPLDLQEQFVSSAKRIRKVRIACEKHLTELDALIRSLKHRAFRGEL